MWVVIHCCIVTSLFYHHYFIQHCDAHKFFISCSFCPRIALRITGKIPFFSSTVCIWNTLPSDVYRAIFSGRKFKSTMSTNTSRSFYCPICGTMNYLSRFHSPRACWSEKEFILSPMMPHEFVTIFIFQIKTRFWNLFLF